MLDFINPVRIYQNMFGNTIPEPICETADLLCKALEDYGYEVHSPASLVNTAQALSDSTGISENASYLTVVAGTFASTIAAIYGVNAAVKSIMKRGDEKLTTTTKPSDTDSIDVIKPVAPSVDQDDKKLMGSPLLFTHSKTEEKTVTVTLKPSHAALVAKYVNEAHKEAVAKMTGAVLTAFNELSPQTVIAFGNSDSNTVSNVLKFNKLSEDKKIEMLGNMERMVQAQIQKKTSSKPQ